MVFSSSHNRLFGTTDSRDLVVYSVFRITACFVRHSCYRLLLLSWSLLLSRWLLYGIFSISYDELLSASIRLTGELSSSYDRTVIYVRNYMFRTTCNRVSKSYIHILQSVIIYWILQFILHLSHNSSFGCNTYKSTAISDNSEPSKSKDPMVFSLFWGVPLPQHRGWKN